MGGLHPQKPLKRCSPRSCSRHAPFIQEMHPTRHGGSRTHERRVDEVGTRRGRKNEHLVKLDLTEDVQTCYLCSQNNIILRDSPVPGRQVRGWRDRQEDRVQKRVRESERGKRENEEEPSILLSVQGTTLTPKLQRPERICLPKERIATPPTPPGAP